MVKTGFILNIEPKKAKAVRKRTAFQAKMDSSPIEHKRSRRDQAIYEAAQNKMKQP